ncbi:hypothetical protein O181_020898 [Austropuccinia psidii MF-1]|uniref:Reverse transcriptase Ty1/copia-type domain-containing protein n=1 Tax=Austropuccinia psidii MF-1 TaxID=1389203 RepID=A0A9Q3CDU0_9BASI|nr:hypothetical protein [Austropuccinia psidii MF-1]
MYSQAINHLQADKWKSEIIEQISSIEENGVWQVVPLLQEANLLGSTWVFGEKEYHTGKVVRYKARLCIQGFAQIEGIDYNETYALTGRLASLCFLISYCAINDFEIHKMDVCHAFLHGITKEKVFMKYPEEYPHAIQPKTCLRLIKSLYGLKQIPRCWYKRLKDVLNTLKFEPCQANPGLFISTESSFCAVFVHVDDMLIGGELDIVERFKSDIKKVFSMDNMIQVQFILGMKINQNQSSKTITLSQQLYIDKILKEFRMENCKPVTTPMAPGIKLVLSNETNQDSTFAY